VTAETRPIARNSMDPASVTTAKTAAHHQSNPAWVIRTPKASPSGIRPSPTGAASASPLRISARVEGADDTPRSLASTHAQIPPVGGLALRCVRAHTRAMRTLLRPGPPGIREVIEYSVDEAVEGARRPPHRGLPSTTLTVVFATSGPLLCSADHESWAGRRGTTHDVCVGAFHTQPVYLQRPDHQDGVQVGLHPLAARRVLGLPAAALTALTQEGEAVAGSSMRTLWSRAGSAAPGERARLIADGLASVADRHDRAPAPRREVLGAWNLLARARGTMTITDVAFRVGLSSRHLSSLVRAE